MITDNELRTILREAKTIAVVGAKDRPGQPVDEVGRFLIECGYDVIPVHPKRRDVWGLTTYPSLADIPRPVDIVDLFRAPQFCAEHARETLRLSPLPGTFWMQAGISSPEAEEVLKDSGIRVVDNSCIMVVHRLLLRD